MEANLNFVTVPFLLLGVLFIYYFLSLLDLHGEMPSK